MFQSFQTPVYAGFWLRFAAYLIDSILLGLVTLPVGFALGVIMAATETDNDPGVAMGINLLINAGSILMGWLYSSLLESSS